MSRKTSIWNDPNLKYYLAGFLIVAVVIIALVIGLSGSPAPAEVKPATSDVVGIDLVVYEYQNSTEPLTQIIWSPFEAEKAQTKTVYVEADTTSKVTVIASAWNPVDVKENNTVEFTYEMPSLDHVINAGYRTQITLSLRTGDDISTLEFSFKITIIGERLPNRFLQTYGKWQIYIVEETPQTYYLAVHAENKRIILGVDLPDLLADLDEAER